MFYWFQRDGELLRYEARRVSATRFTFTIIRGDGTEHVETFDTAEALHAREVAFARDLTAQGWNGPHGWNV